jgi:hypothetical protein
MRGLEIWGHASKEQTTFFAVLKRYIQGLDRTAPKTASCRSSVRDTSEFGFAGDAIVEGTRIGVRDVVGLIVNGSHRR